MRQPMALVAAVFALLGPGAGALAQDRSQAPAVGELLPDLELPTIDGAQVIRLSELRGKRLLLIQFASW